MKKLVIKRRKVGIDKGRTWACLFAVLVLIASGVAYRAVGVSLGAFFAKQVDRAITFSVFPANIGQWVGSELSIPSTTREYMEKNFADDYLSRRYTNSTTGVWSDMYAVYCSSRPAGILGHRPRVCYPAVGWIHDSTEESLITTALGRRVPCLIHRFHKQSSWNEIVVLSFYLLNGKVTINEQDFSGLLEKRPNIEGNPARYVANIQIRSVLENSVRQAATDMVEMVMDFLPDADGQVRAAEMYGSQQQELVQ